MNSGPALAEELACRVADGEPADWERALDSTTDPQVRRVIESLRLLEGVARIHRGDSSPDEGAEALADTVAVDHAIRRWGHLELRERLGQGGFGEVFRAWDPQLEREVALKLVTARDSAATAATSQAVAEGRLLARVRHPNVVTVHGADVRDGRVGLWMELVRGRSLEQLLAEHGPLGAREAALIGIDVCRALAAVHRVGVVHRDIKAQNVMREEGGRILLMDFGAGLDQRREGSGPESISGTPLYMAPELFRDEPASPRSDIYSLGVLMYRLVSGAFPVSADSWKALSDRHARRERRLLRDERPDLPEAFLAVVERAQAWDPAERFATVGEMEQALARAIGMGVLPAAPDASVPAEAPARRVPRWAPALAGVALLVITGMIALRFLGPDGVSRMPTQSRLQDGVGTGAVTRTVEEKPDAPETQAGATTPAGATKGVAAGAATTFTVEAGVYRFPAGSDQRQRLESGAQLAIGDRLNLDFEASAPLYVYVINEDEAGHSYALFPLPGFDAQNPLAAGVKHTLPGSRDRRNLSWTVDSPGGREHLLVLASPTRLVEFEADMNGLARPGQIAVPIPEAARIHLRGLGGLSETPGTPGRSASPLFEMAQRLAARSEVTRGVWVRRLDLENPRP